MLSLGMQHHYSSLKIVTKKTRRMKIFDANDYSSNGDLRGE